ncbi:sulfur carrier protein ThiS [Pseudogracilibacillus auburnensis]|uniref:Sulfur carrier protein n=1 Tax=Pseudogracilibacillus auburnensis TaxID=1494959 RepID=A0A2V3VWH5_9BACI|nr:sulfur carrier protein ThiS [Pseudogracilibacillus auburnensis]MBO1002270.1 sulfur carrier protein ThiS [Pseudogracilibacillus auburnensis]PXW86343.1 sulfur carrier protein [Pseudogracilibacillus auburnensis]
MKLQINGAEMEIPKTIKNITQLIDHLKLNSPVIIVEHNDVILPKEDLDDAMLTAGDKVEFVQFVGGG